MFLWDPLFCVGLTFVNQLALCNICFASGLPPSRITFIVCNAYLNSGKRSLRYLMRALVRRAKCSTLKEGHANLIFWTINWQAGAFLNIYVHILAQTIFFAVVILLEFKHFSILQFTSSLWFKKFYTHMISRFLHKEFYFTATRHITIQ